MGWRDPAAVCDRSPLLVWHILTGEYPPHFGGVALYTQAVANGLVEAGDEVHVWAPPPSVGSDSFEAKAVRVHRLPGHFDLKALVHLSRQMNGACDDQIVVEYVPQAFGYKGMNLPFCFWLFANRRRKITVVFHEVAQPLTLKQPWKYNILAVVHPVMAWLVARSATRIFVTIPGWIPLLRPMVGASKPIRVVPAMNLIPVVDDPAAILRLRARYAPNNTLVIGHFGTYGRDRTAMLKEALPSLLSRHAETRALLLGSGGPRFRDELVCHHPEISDRIFSPGYLPEPELSAHLSTCDILLQPFSDGITARRTTLMAGLAHARPIVATLGSLSETFWAKSGAVHLAPVDGIEEFVKVVEDLISDPVTRRRVGQAGEQLYRQRFALNHTISSLRQHLPCAHTSPALRESVETPTTATTHRTPRV